MSPPPEWPRHADAALFAARLGLASVFVFSGATKLIDPAAGAAEMAHFNLPAPALTNALVVLLQLGGAAALISGVGARFGAAALAGFTALATLLAHAFWTFPPEQQIRQATIFLEHAGLVSALGLIAAIGPGAWRLHVMGGVRARLRRAR